MRRSLSWKASALIVLITSGAMAVTAAPTLAANKPLVLTIPSQLTPYAQVDKMYTYSFIKYVTGGSGKPYSWTLTGTLPKSLKLNASAGLLSGKIASNVQLGTYPLKVCAIGVKKTGFPANINTACKSTVLVVVANASLRAWGTYSQKSADYPDLNTSGRTGCEARVLNLTIELYENKTGQILGVTDTSLTLTWSVAADKITVNFETRWGPRGPKVWKWTGDDITGELPVFCTSTDVYRTLLNEIFIPFKVHKG